MSSADNQRTREVYAIELTKQKEDPFDVTTMDIAHMLEFEVPSDSLKVERLGNLDTQTHLAFKVINGSNRNLFFHMYGYYSDSDGEPEEWQKIHHVAPGRDSIYYFAQNRRISFLYRFDPT